MSLAKGSQTSSHEAMADSLQLVFGVTHVVCKKVQALRVVQKLGIHFPKQAASFCHIRCCGFS